MSTPTYTNPVWDGYCADPFVLKHNGTYYCYGTGATANEFACLRSTDLVHWEDLGNPLEAQPDQEKAHYWAPEVAYANGKFWMYFSNDAGEGESDATHRLHVAVADLPQGPFHIVKEILLPEEGFTIDASPFQDPKTGKWYLYFAKDFFDDRVGTGTAVVELGEDMMSLASEVKTVVRASADWQIYERNRTIYDQTFDAWHTVEGPCVVLKDGLYYCFYAAGNWQNASYGVSYAVAEHPEGPWRDEWSAEGAQVLRGTPEVIGPGHNSVVIGPDDETLFCVYHAWNPELTKRQLCIDPIEWTANGPKVTFKKRHN